MRDTFEMAREAGLEITVDPTETPLRTFVEGWDDQLKAFEALVRADERESCAKVCDEASDKALALQGWPQDDLINVILRHHAVAHQSDADAIRATGETK
jgi:hypothetical protein